MKQPNIPMIIISVIAFAVLLAVIGGSVFLIAYHIKYKEAPLSPAMPVKTQEKKDTAETAAENVDTTAEDQSTPTGENNETTAQEPPEEEPSENARFEGDHVLKIGKDAGQTYIDSITWFGDTAVYSLLDVKPGETPGSVWFCKDGVFSLSTVADGSAMICTSVSDEGSSLAETLVKNKPSIIAVSLSAEQAALSKEEFKEAYKQLIDTVVKNSSNATVICFTIYPVCRQSESTTALTGGINNENVSDVNDCIVECAKEFNEAGQNVYLLDAWSALADKDGYLPDALSTGDGLHLTAEAYDKVFAYLRTHRVPEV